jgi:hypothetical protein
MRNSEGTGPRSILGLALLIALAALLVPQARAMTPDDVQLRQDVQSVAQITAVLLTRLPGATHHLQSALSASHAEQGQVELATLLATYSQASESMPGAPSWTRVPVSQLDRAAQLASERGLVVRVPAAGLTAILNGSAPRYLMLDPVWQSGAQPSNAWEGYDLHTGRRVRLHCQAALASPTLILSLPGQSMTQDLDSEAASIGTSPHGYIIAGNAAQARR